jgi:hypothetical protein
VTRVCVQCGERLGEKCVRCGAEARPIHADVQSTAPSENDFGCSACGHHFTGGEGGNTGGMCEACFDEALRKAHEVQKAGRR